MNPKYDPENYLKHSPVIIHKNDEYQKLGDEFGSYLLLVKWRVIGALKAPLGVPLIGSLKMLQSTPLGDFEPKYYNLNISPPSKQYIQFLAVTNPDYGYKLEIKNPTSIPKSQLEIWEFNNPQAIVTINGMPYFEPTSVDLAPLTAATAANAAAIGSLTTAVNNQPGLIADAIENNPMTPFLFQSIAVGLSPISVLTADQLRQTLTAKNVGSGRIKLWIGATLPVNVTNYSGKGFLIDLGPNGSYEFLDGDQKSQVWAIANNAAAELSLMGSATTP